MNAWKIRHEGSPVVSADLSWEQVAQGLIDAKIHTEDEIKGPQDAGWVKIEEHPAFAEIVTELEPEEEDRHEDETTLDMNPMIDVALVLLVFFILTTTYAQLQKIIEAAEIDRASKTGNIKIVDAKEAEKTMVIVEARQKGDRTTIYIEKKAVALNALTDELKRFARDPNRRTVVIDHERKVPHGIIVAIQDKAKQAGMTGVRIKVD